MHAMAELTCVICEHASGNDLGINLIARVSASRSPIAPGAGGCGDPIGAEQDRPGRMSTEAEELQRIISASVRDMLGARTAANGFRRITSKVSGVLSRRVQ